MVVNSIRFTKVTDNPKRKSLMCSFVIDDWLVVTGASFWATEKGYKLSWPDRLTKDGKNVSLVYPKVLEKHKEVLEQLIIEYESLN